MGTALAVHDPVVLVGHGVGTVACVDDDHIVIKLTEGSATLPSTDVVDLLRPVVARDEAEKLLSRLCERYKEQRSIAPLRSSRELARAPIHRQVEYARLYFRKKKALHPAEVDMILPVCDHVFAELAVALGVEEGDLRAAVKRGVPEITRRTVRTLPTAPALEGGKHLRSFWLGKMAIVGESPEKMGRKLAVQPGAWHAYFVEARPGVSRAFEGLVLRHGECGATDWRTAAETYVGGVEVEGGTIGVIDADALLDPAFGADEVERTRRDGSGFGDRGVEASTLGDGEHRIVVDREDAATCILLPF